MTILLLLSNGVYYSTIERVRERAEKEKKHLHSPKRCGKLSSVGALAQLGARHTGSVEAVGSSPICSTDKVMFEPYRFEYDLFLWRGRRNGSCHLKVTGTRIPALLRSFHNRLGLYP